MQMQHGLCYGMLSVFLFPTAHAELQSAKKGFRMSINMISITFQFKNHKEYFLNLAFN
jgi:hypothetical protein